jgi:hypothetical protein
MMLGTNKQPANTEVSCIGSPEPNRTEPLSVSVRIIAERRGAAPTSGPRVVPDLSAYKPKLKPEPVSTKQRRVTTQPLGLWDCALKFLHSLAL